MAVINGTGGADVLFGSDDPSDEIYGLGGDDWIQAGGGDDTLVGDTGADALWANAGFDIMIGGKGGDTYHISNLGGDTITENFDEGTDRVHTYFIGTYDMLADAAEVENLRIVGTLAGRHAQGNTYNNTMEGNRELNTLLGGDGDDVIIVHDTVDVADGEADTGAGDTILVDFTANLGATANWTNIENITLAGSAKLNATGSAGNNTITGNLGVNTLTGGLGDDNFVIQTLTDKVIEAAGEGNDTVSSEITYSIAALANLENITLLKTGNVNATGNANVNTLTGNDGNNSLDGLTGADTLMGGKGNDIFFVDNAGDVVTENAGEGTDTVRSSVTFDMTALETEHLTLTGILNIDGTGNAYDNTLIGNAGVNTLQSGDGTDYMDGGGGVDTMIGGMGDNTYILNLLNDVVDESGGAGVDTVKVTLLTGQTYVMTMGVEVLNLMGTAVSHGTGNASDNTITGNAASNLISGGDGSDTITGGNGNNNLNGDDGDDTLTAGTGADVINGGLGNDSISAGGGTNTINGDDGNDTITSGGGGDIIHGNDGNDSIDAGSGNNRINGDDGDDSITSSGAGTDIIDGGFGDDILHGDLNNDTLTGGIGNDFLDGGGGTDRLLGGTGNDIYGVDNVGDVIVDAPGDAADWVYSFLDYIIVEPNASYEIENLNLDPITPEGVHGTALRGTGNSFSNEIIGNVLNNTLNGMGGVDFLHESANPGADGGNDTYDGGTGADIMTAGKGDDLYFVDNPFDNVNELATEGQDTIRSSVTYDMSVSASGEVESLTLTGAVAIDGTGNDTDNTITGNSAINTLAGGLGDDNFVVGAGDEVIENTGEGTLDTIMSSITWVLAGNGDNLHEVEGLTLTGTAIINGTGNELDNRLKGNGALNTLTGGLGNDTFVIDDAGDLIDVLIDVAGEGTADNVEASINYTLAPSAANREIENITQVGTDNINAIGNDLNNTITGNEGNNSLDGSAGDDTLIGGKGNDTVFVDAVGDMVMENPGEGTDHVVSMVTFDLSASGPDFENLTLSGVAAIDGTGTTGANTITGNGAANVIVGLGGTDTLSGNGGDDVITGGAVADSLDGGAGDDAMSGGDGNDVYFVDSAADVITENPAEGADKVLAGLLAGVTYTLSDNIEQITLTGLLGSNATGSADDNTIVGNAAINTLTGGGGDDTLFVTLGDDARDLTGEGTDFVYTSISWTLAANGDNLHEVEGVSLTGNAPINATGNELDNTLVGNAAINTLDGSTGADILEGKGGNDVYIVDDQADFVDESTGAGAADKINSTVDYDMNAQTAGDVEILQLLGLLALVGIGSSSDNTIIGSAGVDTTMDGGGGNDTFIVDGLGDIVTDADSGGADTLDTVLSSVTFTIGAADEIEILTLTGAANINGTGNDTIGETITGNTGVNTLSGMGGDDTLSGGTNDFLFGGVHDTKGDTAMVAFTANLLNLNAGPLWEGIENITLTGKVALNATGDANNNTLTGNEAKNTLNGNGGTDWLIGGKGDDLFIVDDATDVVDELTNPPGGGGIDTVNAMDTSYSIANLEAQGVEKLILIETAAAGQALNGTGNDSNNYIKGNALGNILDGGLGADTLEGGAGNDTYMIDAIGDLLKEASGIDLVISTLPFYTLLSGFENLTLGGTNDISGTGNTVSNTITGNAGKNTLDGGSGADFLIGGADDDVFIVDNALEQGLGRIVELAGEGVDEVRSKITFSIANFGAAQGNEVENLTLTGKTSIHGTGNDLANTLTGNAGVNSLAGGDGNDTLDGGAGSDRLFGQLGDDTFFFSGESILATGFDTIMDFDNIFEGDSILVEVDIDPLLEVYEDFVDYRIVGADTQIWVDLDGIFGTQYAFKQVALVLNSAGMLVNN